MLSFFTSEETSELHTPLCDKCGLFRTCKSPRMKASGKGNRQVLVVAEAPGEQEDEQGVQLVGTVGQHLRDILDVLHFNLDEDFRKINAVNCRPPNNREPTDKEIECCRGLVLKEIYNTKPLAIVLLGKSAIKSVIGPLYKDTEATGTVSVWVDRKIPYHKYKTWLYPTYHPSYLLRNDKDPLLKWSVLNAFRKASHHCSSNEVPPTEVRADIEIVTDPKSFMLAIRDMYRDGSIRPIAFDYETSGLRPDRKGHFIRSLALSNGVKTYSGLVNLSDSRIYNAIRSFLLSRRAKIAANIKFETRWSRKFFGVVPVYWSWDTMVAQHWLDNRAETTSLKFQAFVRWGVSNYGLELEPYIKTRQEFNRIAEAPVSALLQYGGLDALYEYRLSVAQRREMAEIRHDKFEYIQPKRPFEQLLTWMENRNVNIANFKEC